MLCVVMLLSVILAYFANGVREHSEALEAVNKLTPTTRASYSYWETDDEIESLKITEPRDGGVIVYTLSPAPRHIRIFSALSGNALPSQITAISIYQRNFSDDDILEISKMFALREISLGQSSVTNKGLTQLATLRNLDEIYVSTSNNNITRTGIDAIQNLLPACSVHQEEKMP